MRRRRRLLSQAHVMADEDLPDRGWIGRVQITNVIHPSSGRKPGASYPEFAILQVRLGDVGAFASVEMSWSEARQLHERLDGLLKQRRKLIRAVDRAKREGRSGVR